MQIKDLTSQITRFKAFPIVLRLGIFVALAVVCVLMFPRYNNAFRYHYEVGKPWGYGTLTADFDFPIYKTDEQLQTDQKQLLSTFAPYFKYLPRVQREVKVVSLGTMEWMQSEGYTRIAINQSRYPLSEVYTPMTAHKTFGYDCAQNLVLDTAKTEDMRTKLLSTISPTQGLVQKGEKIIDKGEIVTERNYQILQSLRRAYEDESLGHRQRTLSIFGEAMLVVLFLSLFVIYLYVFRAAYLRSTSTVLFFCLQMFIVIALACLALRFNLSVYLIPFAWVPILTRVFFDSRTALFLHFTTILISSIVVPAPVEFFFIQIVVGMVAVSSLSDMTRRAQLVQTAAWIFLAQSVAYTALTFAQTGVWSSIDLWMYLYFFICGLFFPVNFVTLVRVFQWMNLTNTRLGIILVFTSAMIPFCVFTIYSFVETVPKELDEAATIDGAGAVTMFFRVILPLLKPTLMTCFVLQFMGVWNDFLTPLYLSTKSRMHPMTMSVYQFFGKEGSNWNYVFADIVMTIIPVVAVYAVGQRYIIGGVSTSGGIGKVMAATMVKMEEGPYYAIPNFPSVHHTMGGLKINTEAQVLKDDGSIIPGLYAAGEVTGGIHGSNRVGGNALTDGVVFGRIAGKNAAEGK